jgi:hypothetical protein
LRDPKDRAVDLIQKTLCGSPASFWIPTDSRLGFLQGGGMDR